MKCSKCNEESHFNIPESLCPGHWFDWFHTGWVEDGTLTQGQYDDERQIFINEEVEFMKDRVFDDKENGDAK